MEVFLRNGEYGIELRQDLTKDQVCSMLKCMDGKVFETDTSVVFSRGRCHYRIGFGQTDTGIESFRYQLEVPMAGRERIFRRIQRAINSMMGTPIAGNGSTGNGLTEAICRCCKYSKWESRRVCIELYTLDIFGQYCVLNVIRVNG
jgi:hypothetical protein